MVRVDKSDVVIAGNRFSDASAAVQLYAQSLDFIVDGNTSQRTGGMYGIGWDSVDQRKRRRYSTCWFDQWLNNRLQEGFIYQQGAFECGIVGPCAAGGVVEPPAIVALGQRRPQQRPGRSPNHRRDVFFAASTERCQRGRLFGRDTIVEKNHVADTPLAIDVYPRYIDTLLRGNAVERAVQPLRDDGENTWIDPAERLRYQYQSVRQILGPAFVPDDLGPQIDRAGQTRRAGEGRRGRAAAPRRGKKSPRPARRACRRNWRPRSWVCTTNSAPSSPLVSALARGNPGKTELAIRARTEPWSPPLELALDVVPPEGWQASAATRVAAAAGVAVDLKAGMTMPEQADVKQIGVRIQAFLDGVPLVVADRFDVAEREILNWLVLGPLPNRGGTLPDTVVQPAETRLDAAATYETPAGKIGWKPVALGNRYLHLSQLWKPQQPSTALALCCSCAGPGHRGPGSSCIVAALWNVAQRPAGGKGRPAQRRQDRPRRAARRR